MPVTKTREFTTELNLQNEAGLYDGLRRIADLIPQIKDSPLVVLVDQFEEVYSLCKNTTEREAFIGNLLCAVNDSTGNLSVIITLRSDFLGETQRHKQLNQVIGSDQSVIVPAMTEAELHHAIAEPAKQAGYPLDEATVDLLVNDTAGREGALPLLQFALTRIWEGLSEGNSPSETYRKMDGIGGTLAEKAQNIYDQLTHTEKDIARRIFVGLVQLGEGTRDTRRRVTISSLTSHRDDIASVKKIIDRFSSTSARLVTLLSSSEGEETAEVTHEALFDYWQQLDVWLDESRDDLRLLRRLDTTAQQWEENGRPNGSLWRRPELDLLQKFCKRGDDELTKLQRDFYQASKQAETFHRFANWIGVGVLTASVGLIALQWQRSERQLVLARAGEIDSLLSSAPNEGLLRSVETMGMSLSPFVRFPNYKIPGVVIESLRSAVQLSRERDVLSDHTNGVNSVAIVPGDTTIISGDEDGALRLWGREGKSIWDHEEAHPGGVKSIAIGSNGDTIVSGGRDGMVKLWDQEGTVQWERDNHHGMVLSVAISSDGNTIVSGGQAGQAHCPEENTESIDHSLAIPVPSQPPSPIDEMPVEIDKSLIPRSTSLAITDSLCSGEAGMLGLWDREGNLLWSRENTQNWISSVAISSDGNTIVDGGEDGTVRLWDREGNPIWSRNNYQIKVLTVAISSDGNTIVSGDQEGTVRLWDRDGNQLSEVPAHRGEVWSVAISPDGNTIVSGSREGTVRLWDREGNQLSEAPLLGHQGEVLSVGIGSDGNTIVSGGEDGTVRLWDWERNLLSDIPLPAHQSEVRSVAISGSTIVSGGFDGVVRSWNREGHRQWDSKDHQDLVWTVAISSDESTIVSGGNDGAIRLWTHEGNLLWIQNENLGIISAVAISSDGKAIISGGNDGKIRMWDRSGNLLWTREGHQEWVSAVTISSDGNTIVSGSRDGTVRLWNRKGRALLDKSLPNHRGWVRSVAISSDGSTIVSGSADGTVRLWDHRGNPVAKPLEGHQGEVWSVAISSDGNTIVSGGDDGTVRLWDRRGNPVAKPLEGHQGELRSVAISSDGKAIVSGGADGTVRLWDTDWKTLLVAACQRLRHHPAFSNPKPKSSASHAKTTCNRYVWRNGKS